MVHGIKRREDEAGRSTMEDLPYGVRRVPLSPHPDGRGWLAELFREEWDGVAERFRQWNAMHSLAGSLRGVHVHLQHHDYQVVLRGEMLLGLKDLREASPSFGRSALVTVSERVLTGYLVPPGVAHGFYFPVETLLVYGVSHYWNPADELGCRWDDPELGISWPVVEPILSPRDAEAPPLRRLMETIRQRRIADAAADHG
jgi:dTDP-4-dehydrorhamnose 3,5-epimerase